MRVLTILLLMIGGFGTAFGQADAKLETTFELRLQTVAASPTGRTVIPTALESAVKKIKNTYDLSGFAIEATWLHRGSNSVEYKGVIQVPSGPPKFAEWSIRGLRRIPDEGDTVVIEGFRYGSRVPIGVAQAKADGSTGVGGVAYEWIGISSTRFKVVEGEPTLVGTMPGDRPGEVVFLFLTATAIP